MPMNQIVISHVDVVHGVFAGPIAYTLFIIIHYTL